MIERRSGRLAVGVGAFVVALTAANVVLLVVGRDALTNDEGDLIFGVAGAIGCLLYAVPGLLIAVRVRNVVGWCLVVIGLIYGLAIFGNAYAAVGLLTYPGSLPAAEEIATLLGQLWVFAIVALAVLLLLFPDGRPPSRRWRAVLWLAIGGAVSTYVLFVVKPGPIHPLAGLSFPDPLAIPSAEGVIVPLRVATAWVTVLSVLACLPAMFLRYRRGDAELRQQVRWLGLVALLGLAFVGTSLVSLIACGCDESPVAVVAFTSLVFLLLFGVPAAILVALFKYRLYDLDLVISKALVYGLLAAVFTGVYLLIVIGVGTIVGDRGSPFLTVVTAVAIAVAFQPIRQRVTHLANRVVYGKRATPYEVLSEFSSRVTTEYASDDVLPRMAQVLANGTGATSARVWPRIGEELRPAASWPANGEAPPIRVQDGALGGFGGGEEGVEVRQQGELLGALSVTMPPNDPMNPSKERLVRDLAAQAGLVLRNVRLIEELRASRRRIVTAQDERAKRLERNIHDGAQQQLVALGVQLGLARRLAERDTPEIAETFDRLQAQTTDALENLRDLARGIYPPLLADQGLTAALEAQAAQGADPGPGRGGGHPPVRAGGRGCDLLLRARGAAERRQGRERLERHGSARRVGRADRVRGHGRRRRVRSGPDRARERAPGDEGSPRGSRRHARGALVRRCGFDRAWLDPGARPLIR
ncbi:MAG TPA: histidine kinase dimerization/phosphoacceptor domain-containing protein [Actinomycetota bacterium]|nr:histidine kinase dimerization/phosphoacceptor domain-containing protein [Actinomycetota bacterium]